MPTSPELHPYLRDRPFDERRKVPVPYMNVMGDGTVNFTGIDITKVYECGTNRLCGICSKPLDYWIAFIGGPVSYSTRMYSDPPMHKECALAAVEFCPHIRVKNHRRTPDEKMLDGGLGALPGAVDTKPDEWIIAMVRDYTIVAHPPAFLFKTAAIKGESRFRYNEAGILEPVE